jgi:hypothetical protein
MLPKSVIACLAATAFVGATALTAAACPLVVVRCRRQGSGTGRLCSIRALAAPADDRRAAASASPTDAAPMARR